MDNGPYFFDPNSKGTFWNEKSDQQEAYVSLIEQRLTEGIEFDRQFRANFPYESSSVMEQRFYAACPDWKFLDSMRGLYHGYYNNGDNAVGSFNNNKIVHRSLKSMMDDPFSYGDHRPFVEKFINGWIRAPEEAMAATVLFYFVGPAAKLRKARKNAPNVGCNVCGDPAVQFKTVPSDGNRYCSEQCFQQKYRL